MTTRKVDCAGHPTCTDHDIIIRRSEHSSIIEDSSRLVRDFQTLDIPGQEQPRHHEVGSTDNRKSLSTEEPTNRQIPEDSAHLAHEVQALTTDVPMHPRVSIDLLTDRSEQAIAITYLPSQLPALRSQLSLQVPGVHPHCCRSRSEDTETAELWVIS